MSKIKVLQFPIANSNGGITHYALENWKWMDRERFHCDFVTMSEHLDFEGEITFTGSNVYHMTCYAEDNRELFMKEFNKILDNDYDVVHLHTKQWKSFLVEELCKQHNVPKVIVHSHSTGIDTLDYKKRNKELFKHEKIKRMFNESMATDFWACSKLAASFLFGETISREKIKIMPNAIDVDKFKFNKENRDRIRKDYKLEDCYVIGHVGRFEYSKNQEFLIDVLYELAKKIEAIRLILIGDGQTFSFIQEKVNENKLNDKVIFLGKRNDVNDWYQAMDVFCLPSRLEGFPISIIEAQASGLYCIGSDCITGEVKECKNVELLPLKKEIWMDKLLEIREVKRENNNMQLIQLGYDIRTQIKCIEKEYSSGKVVENLF